MAESSFAEQEERTVAMTELNKCYVAKDRIVADAETAERLDVEGGVDFVQWIDPGEVAMRVFGISPEQAKAIREEYPSP